MAIYAPLYVVSLYMAIFRDVTPQIKRTYLYHHEKVVKTLTVKNRVLLHIVHPTPFTTATVSLTIFGNISPTKS
jgi:hypothetical protein